MPLKLKIITRRYWPLSGSSELYAEDLATALNREHHDADVVTIRWDKRWPQKFYMLGCSVTRLNRPSSGPWGSYRYIKNLVRHLQQHPVDGLIVFGVAEEAIAIAKNFGSEIPFVIYADEHVLGHNSDGSGLSARQLNAMNASAGIVTASPWCTERLNSIEGLHVDVSTLGPGLVLPPTIERTASHQSVIRQALTEAHPMLRITSDQLLAVCCSPLHGDRGMLDLVHAWQLVARQLPHARLWLLGDGRRSRRVWDEISALRMADHIIMPGQFDDVDSIFQAANIYIHPQRSRMGCGFLPRAMAASLCCVVTKTTANALPKSDSPPIVTAENQPVSNFAAQLINLLKNQDLQIETGKTARKYVEQNFNIERLIPNFLKPIEESIRLRNLETSI